MKKNYAFSVVCFMLAAVVSCTGGKEKKPQPVLGKRSVTIIEKRGLKFKDLNKNGKLDKYEDWRLTPEERSKDLLSKCLGRKAGFMHQHSKYGGMGSREAREKLGASDLDDEGGGRRGVEALVRTDRSCQGTDKCSEER
jgi:beta-glucosidase